MRPGISVLHFHLIHFRPPFCLNPKSSFRTDTRRVSQSEQAFAGRQRVIQLLVFWGRLGRLREDDLPLKLVVTNAVGPANATPTGASPIHKRQVAGFVHRDSPMPGLCQEFSSHKRHVTDVYRTKSDNPFRECVLTPISPTGNAESLPEGNFRDVFFCPIKVQCMSFIHLPSSQ
jgi:hypothetical protein